MVINYGEGGGLQMGGGRATNGRGAGYKWEGGGLQMGGGGGQVKGHKTFWGSFNTGA